MSSSSRDSSDEEESSLRPLSEPSESQSSASQSQGSHMSLVHSTSGYDTNSEVESMEYTTPTQQATQLIDEETVALHDLLWGYLEPLNRQLPRIEFRRSQKLYRIGRTDHKEVCNDYVLTDPRISRFLAAHCSATY